MLPVAELPFLAECEVLGEIELQIWASQDRQDGPDHKMRCQHGHEHDVGAAAGEPDKPVEEAVGCRSRASGLYHEISELLPLLPVAASGPSLTESGLQVDQADASLRPAICTSGTLECARPPRPSSLDRPSNIRKTVVLMTNRNDVIAVGPDESDIVQLVRLPRLQLHGGHVAVVLFQDARELRLGMNQEIVDTLVIAMAYLPIDSPMHLVDLGRHSSQIS